MRSRRLLPTLAAVLVLAGCAATSTLDLPPAQLSAGWKGRTDAGDWPDAAWWRRFGAPELDDLMRRAQNNNRDLQAAEARVAQARAAARVAGSALWPTVSAGVSAGRRKDAGAAATTEVQAALGASYEFDLWGRQRAAAGAADHAAVAAENAGAVVRLALTADVAATHFQILSLNDQLRVAEDNLAISRQLLAVVDAQQRAGRVSALELQRQATQVASAEAALPPLRQQRRAAVENLAVLLGGAVEARPDLSLRTLTVPRVGAGLPADLLARRPDIQRAEADLRAAHADVDAARAALWPTLTLTVEGGSRSTSLSRLFSAGTGYYAVGSDLVAILFDGGRRRGVIDVAEARRAELVAVYRQAILNAVRDVETALAAIEETAAQEDAQQRAVEAAREAFRLADVRFRAGSTDFTTVLDAQRARLGAEAALDPVRQARVGAVVSLYRALGGGWERGAGPLAQAPREGAAR